MKLDLVWSPLARARPEEIRAYVAFDKPGAAERLAIRIVAVIEALRDHPYLGRPGSESDTRELVLTGTPYIYRVRRKRVIILTVWRGAQGKKKI